MLVSLKCGENGKWTTELIPFHRPAYGGLLIKDIAEVTVCRAGFSLGVLVPHRGLLVQDPPRTSEKEKATALARSESPAEAPLGSGHWADTRDIRPNHIMSSTLKAFKVQLWTESGGLSILVLVVNGAVSMCTGHWDSMQR